MGAIDRTDMMISFNDSTRKTTKWYRKLAFHLLDITVLNAFFMFILVNASTKKISFLEFRMNLIRQIFESHHTPKEKRTVPRAIALSGDKHPLRLTGRHFPRPMPTREGQTRKIQKRCYVCSNTKTQDKKRKDTQYECPDCNVALCVYPCFALFHTKKNFLKC
uniref:PiggyBac transposable element-derived protein 4 C-terminal zinc-finger domain-containing protein n=1 Tax=Cuerna arida TaxID=1464854 RepID=A0A1B6EQ72_9HEMI